MVLNTRNVSDTFVIQVGANFSERVDLLWRLRDKNIKKLHVHATGPFATTDVPRNDPRWKKTPIQRFCDYLRENVTLELLDLTGSNFENHIPAIIDAIADNRFSKIETLNLTGAGVTGSQCKHIRDMMKKNYSLIFINLNNNKLDQKGLDFLEEGLQDNAFIEDIYIFGNAACRFAEWSIFEVIARNKKNNKVKDKMKEEIDDSKKARWGRSKLMVIGQGGAGKTSTVRCLLGQPFNEAWDSTIGASLKKTDTTDWAETALDDTGFDEAAARAIWEQLVEMGEVNGGEWEEFAKNQKLKFDIKKGIPLEKTSAQPGKLESGKKKVQKKANKAQPARSRQQAAVRGEQPRPVHQLYEDLRQTSLDIDEEPISPEEFESVNPKQHLLNKTDVARRFKDKLMTKALQNGPGGDDNKLTFTIWDYGGQTVFYTLHHLFLTQYGVYIIAFDLNKVADPLLANDAARFLKFWINSVILHAPRAPCILVGTHLDTLRDTLKARGEAIEDFYDYVNDLLETKVEVLRHEGIVTTTKIVKDKKLLFFPLNNPTGENIDILREQIDESARGKNYVNQEVPLRWLLTLDLLVNKAETKLEQGRSWVSFDEVKEIGKQYNCDTLELVQMLKLFNELGVLIYLGATAALREVVVINPQWLLEMLGRVIRDRMHGAPKGVLFSLSDDWDMLQQKGIATLDLLEALWLELDEEKVTFSMLDDRTKESANKQSQFLVDLMKNSMLLSNWAWDKVGDQVPKFIVPSLLQSTDADVDAINERLSSWNENEASTLFLDFSEFFLPTGIFQRIVCLLVDLIVSQVKDAKEPILGKEFALASFVGEANKTMNTELFIVVSGEDRIMISAKNGENSSDLLLVLLSMVRKLREEVMGSRLKVNVILTARATITEKANQAEVQQHKSTTDTPKEQKETDVLGDRALLKLAPFGPQKNPSLYKELDYVKARDDKEFAKWFVDVSDKKVIKQVENRLESFLSEL